MKKVYFMLMIQFLLNSMTYATAILEILPSTANPIAIMTNNQSYLTYTLKNNTLCTVRF